MANPKVTNYTHLTNWSSKFKDSDWLFSKLWWNWCGTISSRRTQEIVKRRILYPLKESIDSFSGYKIATKNDFSQSLTRWMSDWCEWECKGIFLFLLDLKYLVWRIWTKCQNSCKSSQVHNAYYMHSGFCFDNLGTSTLHLNNKSNCTQNSSSTLYDFNQLHNVN